jgi:hypothetical protein
MLKPPTLIDIGRPFVPITTGHEPEKSGSICDEFNSHVERNNHVENRGRGINQDSPDSWKRLGRQS